MNVTTTNKTLTKDKFPEFREVAKTPAWGYELVEGNPKLSKANPEQLQLLSIAFDRLDGGNSLNSVCTWLASKGYSLSLMGLRKLWFQHRPDSPEIQNRKQKKRVAKKAKPPVVDKAKEAAKKKMYDIAAERRRITAAKKRLGILTAEKEQKEAVVDYLTKPFVTTQVLDQVEEEKRERPVIFKPNDGPQTEFLSAPELEVLFGGAAGGGKSYGLIADPLRYFENKNFTGLLLRRTNDELREIIWKSKELYPQVFRDARFSEKASEWRFPSGARLWMSYLDRDDDVLRYQGQAYTWIGFDELTHWPTPYPWDYLRSRLRAPKDSGLTDQLSMRGCIDEGDVLTERGWVPIQKVKTGEKVYSLSEDGKLELQRVIDNVSFSVEEELVRIRKKNLYMSMTKDHRVVYRPFGSQKYKTNHFDKIGTKSISVARTSSEYDSEGWTHETIDPEFLGLYIAEGSFSKPRKGNYKVVITQNKQINHKYVRDVMERTKLNVCYSKNGDFQITNKKLWEYVEVFGKSYEKHFPRDFLQKATKSQLEKAFYAYSVGDGHWQSPKSCTLTTTSEQLKDDLCEISVKLGWKVQYKKYPSKNKNHKDKYVVYVSLKGTETKIDTNPDCRDDQCFELYKGLVHCLEVDKTNNFVVRQKGYVWISGNTTNPGGPGHGWVKKMFIDPAPENTPFWATNIETGETLKDPLTGEFLFKRRFIPSMLDDNPYLSEDGIYRRNLASLPEARMKQLLEGDWTIADGAAFSEFTPKIHVIKPFEIPKHWTRFRSMDYGYSSFSAVHWFAINPDTLQLVVYRELYASKMTATDLADTILYLENKERISYGVLDSSVWHKRGEGPSIAEVMISRGCRWRPSDRSAGSRIARKNRLHELLKVDEFTKEPGIVFFDTCRQIISDLPVIPMDPKGTEDIDPRFQSDHSYDSIGYGIMSRPKSDNFFYDTQTPSYKSAPMADSTFGY